MTEKLPAADLEGHLDDFVTHALSAYRVRESVTLHLQLQLADWLEGNLEALRKSGRITLLPVRERVCRCWPCTVELPAPAPAPTIAGAPTSAQ